MRSDQTLKLFIARYKQQNKDLILDIGSGDGHVHSQIMKENNLNVENNDIIGNPTYLGDFITTPINKKFDGIWCSHVLEHQRNPGLMLDKIHSLLKEDGLLAITVPPRKDPIVGGHVSLWNTGILLYQLVLAGFDCSEASVSTYGYNCSVIVNKKTAILPDDLHYDTGDIEKLRDFFPKDMNIHHGFHGVITNHKWT